MEDSVKKIMNANLEIASLDLAEAKNRENLALHMRIVMLN